MMSNQYTCTEPDCAEPAVIDWPAEDPHDPNKSITRWFCQAHADKYGLLDEDDDELLEGVQFGELPPGVCPACMGLSPGIAIDGETIMHCPVCKDTGKVTPEEAERYWQAVEEREKARQ